MQSEFSQYTSEILDHYRHFKPFRKESVRPDGVQCIHGQFREDGRVFAGLHPNKSVVERPVAVPHVHDYIEIMYVHKGCCYQHIGNQTLRCDEGSIILLNTNSCHQPWVETGEDIVVNLGIRLEALQGIISAISGRSQPSADAFIDVLFGAQNGSRQHYLHVQNAKNVDHLICEMLCEYHKENDLYEMAMISDLTRLLVELYRTHRTPTALSKDDIPGTLTDIKDYISGHYAQLDMEQLCQQFNYSQRHMRRLLRNLSDESLPVMLNRMKIHKACEYIDRYQMSTDSILPRIGYSNAGHFYRTFKAVVGVSVTDYRYRAEQRGMQN